jgi:hypothetical protein
VETEKPRQPKLRKVLCLTPKAFKECVTFAKAPDSIDLEQFGILKETFDQSLKVNLTQQPVTMMASETGSAGAAASKLTGVIGSSLEAIKMFENTTI